MDDSLRVSVIATDPMLEAGAISALNRCVGIEPVEPNEPAAVTVVMVDTVDEHALVLVRAARAAAHHPQVVLVAIDLNPTDAEQAIAAGARGLLRRREAIANRLPRAVIAAAGGDCSVPLDVLHELVANGAVSGSSSGPRRRGLSDRERAVLHLIADGHETSEIAGVLAYSTRTVTSVVQGITQRFRLRNRAHAVAYALRAGLL